MTTQTRASRSPPLYDAVIGPAMERMAEPIRAFHRAACPARFAGRASVERGANPLTNLVALIIGLPPASADCTIEVLVGCDANGVETWQRTFGASCFTSTQEPGAGSWNGLVVERFGPMAFAMAVVEKGGELHLDLRGWRLLGMPMPDALGPRIVAFEHASGGRFNFHVDMALPLLGRIVRYRGWLEPVNLQSHRI